MKKTNNTPKYIGSLKAIPLAALIAMSPLTTSTINSENSKEIQQKIELFESPKNKVVETLKIDNAMWNGKSCYLDAISNDGNDTDYEIVRLRRRIKIDGEKFESIIEPKQLVKHYDENSDVFLIYFVKGPSILKDKNNKSIYNDKSGWQITLEFYEDLKELFGDKIEYIKEYIENDW